MILEQDAEEERVISVDDEDFEKQEEQVINKEQNVTGTFASDVAMENCENNDDSNDDDSLKQEETASASSPGSSSSFNKRELLELCENRKTPKTIVESWLKSHSKEQIEEASLEKDNSGVLPLHYACRCSDEVFQKIFEANPEAASVKNRDGWFPLHWACLYGRGAEVIQMLFEANKEAVRVKDCAGGFPLHLACGGGCSAKVIQMLIEAYPEAVSAKDNIGRFPLHRACGHCSGEVIQMLFEKYPEAAKDKENDQKVTPFEILSQEKAFPTLFDWTQNELFLLCKNHVPRDLFDQVVLENLELPICMEWLNRLSCKRIVVFHIMLELCLQIAWITLFVISTKSHLVIDEDHSLAYPIALLVIDATFLCFEVQQLYQRGLIYFLDPWNWIEMCAIGLVIASSTMMILEGSAASGNEISNQMKNVFIATGFFLFATFVSYLKKTFLPFARFVTGVIEIFWVLVPFLVITAITLFVFSYAYFVQSEGQDSLGQTFLNVYASFVGGPDDTLGTLDILFGLVIVIVLLNVVIAIVSDAWGDSAERAKKAFWKYRLAFIHDVAEDFIADHKKRDEFCAGLLGSVSLGSVRGEFLDKWTLSKVKNRIKWNNRIPLKMFVCIVLGFFTFGIFWPMFFRESLFTDQSASREGSKDDEPPVTELKKQFDETKQQMTELAAKHDKQLDENKKRMEELAAKHEKQINDLAAENKELVAKQEEQIEDLKNLILKLVSEQSNN